MASFQYYINTTTVYSGWLVDWKLWMSSSQSFCLSWNTFYHKVWSYLKLRRQLSLFSLIIIWIYFQVNYSIKEATWQSRGRFTTNNGAINPLVVLSWIPLNIFTLYINVSSARMKAKYFPHLFKYLRRFGLKSVLFLQSTFLSNRFSITSPRIVVFIFL